MGESFGTYTKGADEEMLDYVTSANIACGFHAGDPTTMRKTVAMALNKNVGIGAHPGLQDLMGFGRRNIDISPQETYDLIVYQIGALHAFVKAEGGQLQHVKPHGALYNMAVKNRSLAKAIAEAVYKVNSDLILIGLAESELIKAGKEIGLHTASEVFADRTYQEDGTLTSRIESNALIRDKDVAVKRVVRMVKERKITSINKKDVSITADTICIHGDGAQALEFAKYIRKSLHESGVEVKRLISS